MATEKAKRDAADGQLSLFGPDMTPMPHLDEEPLKKHQDEDVIPVNPIHEEVLESLVSMTLDDYSPFEALQALYQIQNKLKGDQ